MTEEFQTQDIDLFELTIGDLVALRDQIDSELGKRQTEAQKQAAAEIRRIAAEAGITLEEITALSEKVKGNGKSKGKDKDKSKVAVKYRHPDYPDQTWSGRGRKPRWIDAEIQQGRALEDFRWLESDF